MITVWNNLGGLILVSATSLIPQPLAWALNILMAASGVVAAIGIALSRAVYKRSDHDNDKSRSE